MLCFLHRFFKNYWFVFLWGLTSSCQGASEEKKEPVLKHVHLESARISKKAQRNYWQQIRFQHQKNPVLKSWALFSYSGWSNVGHCYIVQRKNGQFAVYYAKPNTQEFLKLDLQEPINWKRFQALALELQKQNDFDSKAFDGLQYEYLETDWSHNQVKLPILLLQLRKLMIMGQ